MDLDNESYSYLKDIIGSKDCSNIYFKLGFRDDDGVEYKYELEMYVKNTKEGGSSVAEKQSEKRIIEIDLNFIFDMSSEELKKKYDGKKFKVDGTEWKVKYDMNGQCLSASISNENYILVYLKMKKIHIMINNNLNVVFVENRIFNSSEVSNKSFDVFSIFVKKVLLS